MLAEAAEVSASEKTMNASDVYMHVWPLATRNDGVRGEPAIELELIASHTSDPKHLDPSCPVCRRLRLQLRSTASTVLQRIAPAITAVVSFEIYADPACIVCSPGDGQRPCVTVSIYIRTQFDRSPANSVSAAVCDIKQALHALGIRER